MQFKISRREQEVLKLIADEYTTTEIASLLYISEETVKTHRKHLLFKLQVKNVAGMVRRGFEIGYLHIPTLLKIA